MADSDVSITAGSGTKIDTRTVGAGVDEHRQVMVIGDPSTASDVATVTAANGLKVDVTRVVGSVTIGDGSQNIAIDSAQSDAENNGVNSLHTSSRNYVFNGTTWDRNRGDITNGLDVDVTRIVPGTGPTHLGKAEDTAHVDGDTGVLILGVRNHNSGSTVDGDYSAISVDSTGNMNTLSRRDLQRISVAVSGTSTTAYIAGDQVGTLCTLANASRISGGNGTIVGVSLQGYNDAMGSFDVVFFDNATVTLAGDNNPFSLSADADILESVVVIPLAGSYDLGLSRIAQAYNLAVPYYCSGGTSLYATLITRNGFTNASGEVLQLVVYVERN